MPGQLVRCGTDFRYEWILPGGTHEPECRIPVASAGEFYGKLSFCGIAGGRSARNPIVSFGEARIVTTLPRSGRAVCAGCEEEEQEQDSPGRFPLEKIFYREACVRRLVR